jgi:hypothetical protein
MVVGVPGILQIFGLVLTQLKNTFEKIAGTNGQTANATISDFRGEAHHRYAYRENPDTLTVTSAFPSINKAAITLQSRKYRKSKSPAHAADSGLRFS